MSRKKNPAWFYIVLAMLPFIILLIIEVGLRLFDYGNNLEQWKLVEENRLVLNPNISARYFSKSKDFPHSNNDTFLKEKKANTYRIFVLGGSTAAGFPYSPNGSFSHFLKDYLEHDYPNTHFEVVNLGITAVNSFTVYDLILSVIEQDPDLIIFYMGHNEYYGALGAASSEKFSDSYLMVNTFLKLNKFKIFQLLKNFSTWLINSSSNSSKPKQTLMARMASEQSIKLNSQVYFDGLKQFEHNFNNILALTREKKIHVLVGTLVSNIKNQKPFISASFGAENANNLFELGRSKINIDIKVADSLLTRAKDLDGLRFRAPSKINFIIRSISNKFNYPIVEIEKGFSKASPDNIIGNNLMVDHLHPNLMGYQLMGKMYYQAMIENKLLPTSGYKIKDELNRDREIQKKFAFTKIDSIASQYRITNLLNDWPFKINKNKINPAIPKNKMEQLSYEIVYKQLNWRQAHQEAYRWFLARKDYQNFAREIKVLLSQYPYKTDYYNYAAQKLLEAREFNLAWDFLSAKNKIDSDGFTTKWLGNISLTKKNYKSAVNYYLESLKFLKNDQQVIYNIGFAYFRMNDINNAKKYLQLNLKINPSHQLSKNLIQKLK